MNALANPFSCKEKWRLPEYTLFFDRAVLTSTYNCVKSENKENITSYHSINAISIVMKGCIVLYGKVNVMIEVVVVVEVAIIMVGGGGSSGASTVNPVFTTLFFVLVKY